MEMEMEMEMSGTGMITQYGIPHFSMSRSWDQPPKSELGNWDASWGVLKQAGKLTVGSI